MEQSRIPAYARPPGVPSQAIRMEGAIRGSAEADFLGAACTVQTLMANGFNGGKKMNVTFFGAAAHYYLSPLISSAKLVIRRLFPTRSTAASSAPHWPTVMQMSRALEMAV